MPATRVTSADGLQLPQPPGAVRRFWSAHPRAADVLLAVAYFALATIWALITPLSSGHWQPIQPVLVAMAGVVLTAGALLVRRSRPRVTFAVATGAALLTLTVENVVDPQGMALAVYALFVHRSPRSGWRAFAAVVAIGVLLRPAVAVVVRDEPLSAVSVTVSSLLYVIVVLTAALIGVSVAGRRRYIQGLVDRANQLASERDQQARIATLAERARIVREMHDVLSHSLSVMVSLSDGAAALAAKDPARARDAVGEIGEVGRQSMSDMRRLLGALGDSSDTATGDALQPSPGTGDLNGLVTTFQTARLPVRLHLSGTPSSPGAQNAVYRIVQESLTNVLRYSRDPQHVTVDVSSGADGTSVTVTDDGASGPAAASVGLGHGLIGIRERAALYGGTVTAGPLPDRGWRVQVELPQAEGTR